MKNCSAYAFPVATCDGEAVIYVNIQTVVFLVLGAVTFVVALLQLVVKLIELSRK